MSASFLQCSTLIFSCMLLLPERQADEICESSKQERSFGNRGALHTEVFFLSAVPYLKGLDSSVGIATRYGLDGPGIETSCGEGRDFPHQSRPALGTTQPAIQWVPGLSRGVKRPGRGADHPSLI